MAVGRLTVLVAAAVLLAGCGSKKASAPAASSTTPAAATTNTAAAPGAGALQAEANSAAAGDIPDNQVFLTFADTAGRYSMKYPEGWAQSGAGPKVTFRDKNNIVRIVVDRGASPTLGRVRSEMAGLKNAHVRSAQQVTIGGARVVRVVYTTVSAPNAVTGKRVTLVVDRYYLWHAGKEAIVDLGTPEGVDNVDAYRLMIESFRWR